MLVQSQGYFCLFFDFVFVWSEFEYSLGMTNLQTIVYLRIITEHNKIEHNSIDTFVVSISNDFLVFTSIEGISIYIVQERKIETFGRPTIIVLSANVTVSIHVHLFSFFTMIYFSLLYFHRILNFSVSHHISASSFQWTLWFVSWSVNRWK